jgi:hypothetical protein
LSLGSQGLAVERYFDLFSLCCRYGAGGSYALLNGRGLDITALFESYHPFTERPRARLASFTPVSRRTELILTESDLDVPCVWPLLEEKGYGVLC